MTGDERERDFDVADNLHSGGADAPAVGANRSTIIGRLVDGRWCPADELEGAVSIECPECGLTIRHTEDCPLRHAFAPSSTVEPEDLAVLREFKAWLRSRDYADADSEVDAFIEHRKTALTKLPDDVAGVIEECISDAKNIREAYPSKTLRKAAATIGKLYRLTADNPGRDDEPTPTAEWTIRIWSDDAADYEVCFNGTLYRKGTVRGGMFQFSLSAPPEGKP